MKLDDLLEYMPKAGHDYSYTYRFGLEDKSNAEKAELALEKISHKMKTEADETVFIFDTKEDLDAAIKLVDKVINSNLESRW